MTVTLASTSPRRRVLLRYLLDDFETAAPHVDETMVGPDPVAAIEAVAARKAAAVDAPIVLAADTAVVLDGQILGKAETAEEARAMLDGLRRRHQVTTGLALRRGQDTTTASVTSHLSLHPPADVLDQYIATGAWRGKAGGYGIQDALLAPHVELEGSWSNVVGLPLRATQRLLQDAGIPCQNPPDDETLRAQNPF